MFMEVSGNGAGINIQRPIQLAHKRITEDPPQVGNGSAGAAATRIRQKVADQAIATSTRRTAERTPLDSDL